MIVSDYKQYYKGVIFKGAPHVETELSLKENKDLIRYYSAWFVRNIYNFDCSDEKEFWFVIKDSFNGMYELKSNTRRKVRRSIKSLDILPVTKELILEQGYEVYLMSYERYKNVSTPPVSKIIWRNGVVNSNINVEYWGAMEKSSGKLIAYSQNLIQDNICKYAALKAIPMYLREYYPFYGLIYLMNEHYLGERGMKYVSDGARSVTDHSNIQGFLKKFNFRKAYCDVKIFYIWWLKIIVNFLFPFRAYVPGKRMKYLLNLESMQRGSK